MMAVPLKYTPIEQGHPLCADAVKELWNALHDAAHSAYRYSETCSVPSEEQYNIGYFDACKDAMVRIESAIGAEC